jgi:GntR family transcriptional regulator
VISRDTPVPPYRQLAGILRDQIASGELAPGERLPTILELGAEYGVATPTVRKALAVLKDEGLVVGVGGYGTFVAEAPPGG